MADKSTLLSVLTRAPGRWISAGELKAAVPDVPERTLRNWLTDLVRNGEIEPRGERKGRRYRSRPRGSMVGVRESGHTGYGRFTAEVFSKESEALLRRIEAPIYTRAPVTYREDWLAAYVPNESAYLSASQRESLHALGKRDPIFKQAGTYIRKIYNRLLIDFSYNSARLEGNTYTLADTERLLLQGASAPGKPNAERIMLLNHKEAIAYLARNVETLEADETTIRTIHYLLADSLVASGTAGQIRDESVLITGTTYAPLEGRERLTRLLQALLAKARAITDPFEQSLFLLAHLSYLQAFVDVNKRTARLASIIPLIRADFVPQSFVEVDPGAYLKATIVVYELNDVRPLADLYVWSYRRSCVRYDTQAKVAGFDEISALYRPSRRAMVADLVRQRIPLAKAAQWITEHVPSNVDPEHREKFISDVRAEIESLDATRVAGLGITRQELDSWKEQS
jgi:Fic family protein